MTLTEDQHESSSGIDSRVIDTDGLEKVGRLGWVAKGVVYAIMGVLAVPIAFGGGDDQATRSGALGEIAENSFGGVLLVVVAVGLGLYAAWRLTTAFLPGDNDAKGLAHRIGYLISASVYGYLAYSSLSFVLSDSTAGSGGSGSGGQSHLEKISRTLMESSGGRWLLGIGALVGLGVAGYFMKKAVTQSFKDRLALGGASQDERELIEKSGMVGWIGRSITTGLLAFFVLVAAWTADPDEAKGLDEALRSTADSWWGGHAGADRRRRPRRLWHLRRRQRPAPQAAWAVTGITGRKALSRHCRGGPLARPRRVCPGRTPETRGRVWAPRPTG